MPNTIIPPGRSAASKTTGRKPNAARSCAHASPAGPAPTIATRSSLRGMVSTACRHRRSACALSTPACSHAHRLRARIATGRSNEPRRQAASHGAAQTRPQIDGNGFGIRAMRYANSSSPSAIADTYRPAFVSTGHARVHGTLSSNQSLPTGSASSLTTPSETLQSHEEPGVQHEHHHDPEQDERIAHAGRRPDEGVIDEEIRNPGESEDGCRHHDQAAEQGTTPPHARPARRALPVTRSGGRGPHGYAAPVAVASRFRHHSSPALIGARGSRIAERIGRVEGLSALGPIVPKGRALSDSRRGRAPMRSAPGFASAGDTCSRSAAAAATKGGHPPLRGRAPSPPAYPCHHPSPRVAGRQAAGGDRPRCRSPVRPGPLLVHSTSWRYDDGRVVLTYVVAVRRPDRLNENLVDEPVLRADLAR